jgi:hypothetical protein
MQVRLTVTQPTAFSAGATPQFEILGPITIINGQCNMLPRITNPTFSDLVGHWGSCQNMAYDVNFAMLHPGALGAGAPSGSGTVRAGANSGTSGNPLLKDPGLAGTPMLLSPAPKQGMLESGTSVTTQSPSTNEGMQQNRLQASPANPQPSPPGSKAPRANRTTLKPIKLAPPKALRKITNPHLAEQNASMIAVLQQQRQAAQTEAAAMKPGMRTAASAASVRAPVATASMGSGSVQNLGPETTQSEKGNLASRIVHAPVFNSIVLMCATDPTPRIIQLSGGEGHGILTPEAKYNLYTITGCSFGPSDPGNSAYIFGVNGFKTNLNIDFWSENGITAHLNPGLAGVLDQNNVTLVVAPAGKQPFNKSGYTFYAARGVPAPDGSDQEVPLAYQSMSQTKIGISNVNDILWGYEQVPDEAASQFASFSFQGTPVAGWIFRYASGYHDQSGLRSKDCFLNQVGYNGDTCANFFVIGGDAGPAATPWSDTWDFTTLVPGFSISSYQLFVSTLDPASLCGSWDDFLHDNYSWLSSDWGFQLLPQNKISVTWPVYVCGDHENNPSGRNNRVMQSSYGLAVWVLGPRCIDPWTGQIDQACMNKMKQFPG